MATSESTLRTDEAMRMLLDDMHVPGTVGSHNLFRGMQVQMKLNIRAK
jgi:hypothetical protein